MTVKTVGCFSSEGGVVSGPAEYMKGRYKEVMERIYAGQSAIFNYGSTRPGADVETLVLVCLQTDYAAWRGAKGLEVLRARS